MIPVPPIESSSQPSLQHHRQVHPQCYVPRSDTRSVSTILSPRHQECQRHIRVHSCHPLNLSRCRRARLPYRGWFCPKLGSRSFALPDASTSFVAIEFTTSSSLLRVCAVPMYSDSPSVFSGVVSILSDTLIYRLSSRPVLVSSGYLSLSSSSRSVVSVVV